MKFIIIIFILQACIQVNPSYRNTISEDKFVNSFQQCQNSVLVKDDIVNKFQKLNKNIDTLYRTLSTQTQIKIEQSKVTVIEQNITPIDPLILNKDFFISRYDSILSLINMLDSELRDYFLDGVATNLLALSDNDIQIIAPVIKNSRVLTPLAQRWMQMYCEKSLLELNAADDIRLSDAYVPNTYGEFIEDNMFYDYFYLTFGESLFKNFFSMKIVDKNRKFNCDLTRAGTTINIPINAEDHFVEIKESIEQSWNQNNLLRVVIEKAQTRTTSVIKVSLRKNMISHSLKVGGNEIFLNPTLFDNFSEASKRIIAHEFGHILGFPDCYLEFFDKQDNLVNYSLNPFNMMCSLEGNIPTHYFLQIQNNLCR